MTTLKGFVKVSLSRKTETRLYRIRELMIKEQPDKYDEKTSLHVVIIWMLDKMTRNS